MICNLRTLALILVAAFATSSVFASAAQAEGALGTFTAGETTAAQSDDHTATLITSKQYGTDEENYLEVAGQKVTCENSGVAFNGSDSDGTATSLTLTPTYKDCKAAGLPATITTNGCDYTFTQPTTVIPFGFGTYTGKIDLSCPTNAKVDIEVYLFGGITSHFGGVVCTILVGKANGGEGELGGHVIYSNTVNSETGFRDDVTVKVDLSGIPYTRSGSCGHAEGSDGLYKSRITLIGHTETGVAHDLWISDE